MLLVHNSGLQDLEALRNRCHCAVPLRSLIQCQLDETFSQLWRGFGKNRLSLLEVASDLFVQKWLCLWMLPPLPKVADIYARSSSSINLRRFSSTKNKRLLDLWWQILVCPCVLLAFVRRLESSVTSDSPVGPGLCDRLW